jgi:uncharacterized protein YdeI (YjbR/CyaY-like superfamily)
VAAPDRSSAKEPTLAPKSATAWRSWLKANHAKSAGVWLRIPKNVEKTAAGSALSYAEALGGALTWGWIDSQKKGLDATAWLQRFTPRRPRSPWSKINRAKAETLIADGTMEAPGLIEVERARRDGRWASAYDGARVATVPADLASALARNAKARAFFEALDGANRYAILYRVQSAKKPETRAARILQFVGLCARGETLYPARTPKSPAPKKFGRRADLGAPIDGFFAKQPPHLRPILETLRQMIEEAAPTATSAIKWGMPFYTVGDRMMCALAGFKAHVNLILAGPPGTFADPDGLLEGDGKTGRHLKLRSLDELPRKQVQGWLRTAAKWQPERPVAARPAPRR